MSVSGRHSPNDVIVNEEKHTGVVVVLREEFDAFYSFRIDLLLGSVSGDSSFPNCPGRPAVPSGPDLPGKPVDHR